MNEEKLVIIKDNEESLATILFTYKKGEKNYVVFEFDETEEISAAVFQSLEDETEGILSDIETDEEWDMIDEVLQQYFDELESEETDEEDEE
ncbi:MAG: DUF1292 domain-containing protein [Candidatus Phytoplasma sp.]|nr:DUF1292 domain-containing protein [Phytoplasma sp.]